MDAVVREYLAAIGRKGGQKSRRVLKPEHARAMVQVREARRAFRRYHAQCFWWCDPQYAPGIEDLAWVREQLQTHGDRQAWFLGAKLCP